MDLQLRCTLASPALLNYSHHQTLFHLESSLLLSGSFITTTATKKKIAPSFLLLLLLLKCTADSATARRWLRRMVSTSLNSSEIPLLIIRSPSLFPTIDWFHPPLLCSCLSSSSYWISSGFKCE